MTSNMPLPAGTHLGPYEILALIGAGGMGEVYRARDPRVGREVAIKLAAERFSERFSREAHAVAALNHNNICHLFDVGPNYLVMELIEGPTLAERIKQGPISLEEALAIARQIAAALEAAHEKGVIHRDLKPANVKLTPEGVVKVLDFGLAKIAEPAEAGRIPENSPTLTLDAATRAGEIMGTAGYMSPEQARGKIADKRADIWAFGVVLYELVTGERLFRGADISEILAAVIKEEPKLDRAPWKVRRLLAKCLEKDPKRRLRDIGDAWELLETDTAPVEAGGRASRKAGWAAAGVFAIGLAAVSWLHFREPPGAQASMRLRIEMPENASSPQFAISPDGRVLAIAATQAATGKGQLWLRPLNSPQAQLVAGTEGATYPFWSPDSRYVGFFADGKLKKVVASGGPPEALCDAPEGRGGSWNRDGVILFSTVEGGGFGIRRVAATGGASAVVIKTAKGIARFPVFLPDGRHFLYVVTRASPEENGIYFSSLDGKENRRILPDESSPALGAGRLLFVRENTLLAQRLDPDKGQIQGDPIPISTGVSLTTNVVYAPVSASDNGIMIYESGSVLGKDEMRWYDRDGKLVSTGAGSAGFEPAISPDGKSVVFMRLSSTGSDLWLWDLSREAVQLFHKDPTFAQVPFWSPQGDRIIFSSNRDGGVPNFYVISSSGAGQDERVFASPARKTATQWSHDGRFIVYSETNLETREDLWVLPMENGKAGKPISFLHSEFNESFGQLSPDSRWMAYTSDESGRREVYVRTFPAGEEPQRISIDGGDEPRWKGDGTELYFIGADGKVMAVPIKIGTGAKASLEPGRPRPLFAPPPLGHYGANAYDYDVTPDGKRFVLNVAVAGGQSTPPLNVILSWDAGLKK